MCARKYTTTLIAALGLLLCACGKSEPQSSADNGGDLAPRTQTSYGSSETVGVAFPYGIRWVSITRWTDGYWDATVTGPSLSSSSAGGYGTDADIDRFQENLVAVYDGDQSWVWNSVLAIERY